MSRRAVAAIVRCLLTLLAGSQPGRADDRADSERFWPPGVAGAVSITFDDGLPSQLAHAVPLLERHDVQASFYVNPHYSIDWETNIPAWQRLVTHGHELGNHTDRHTCSCRHDFGVNLSFCLEDITIDDIARAIEAGSLALRETFTGDLVDQSFAYPCYESFVGTGLTRRSYVPEVAKRYLAGRAGQGFANDPHRLDLSHLYSYPVDGRTLANIKQFIEQEISRGQWVILTVHGVDDDWEEIDAVVLDRLLEYLRAEGRRIWVAPLITVARYVSERR
jgi:peptidoglycan/xylan/chitin deacetylase (PgdA/CDA1 family)